MSLEVELFRHKTYLDQSSKPFHAIKRSSPTNGTYFITERGA